MQLYEGDITERKKAKEGKIRFQFSQNVHPISCRALSLLLADSILFGAFSNNNFIALFPTIFRRDRRPVVRVRTIVEDDDFPRFNSRAPLQINQVQISTRL